MDEEFGTSFKKPSRLYYLLPVFFGIIGGVIGYFLVRNRDKKFAERLLIVGLVLTILYALISTISRIFISMWLTSFTKNQTETVESRSRVELVCSYGNISLISLKYCNGALTGTIENTGSIALGSIKLQILYTDGSLDRIDVGKDLTPKESYQFSSNIRSNYNKIRILTNCSSVYDESPSTEVIPC